MTKGMEPREVLAADEIDLAEADFWRRPWEEREGAFRTLRRERPLAFFREADMGPVPAGPGYWSLTKHADILAASHQPQIFSSARGATSIPDLPQEFLEFFGGMINMDDPAHQRLRKLVSAGFTPRQLTKVSADVENAAGEILAAVAERGQCDFVTDLAAPFPIRIICDMMGIPESQRDFVFDRTNIILGAGDPEYVASPEEAVPAILGAGAELVELMREMRRSRLADPKDDLTSMLVNAEVDGDRLSEEDLGSFFVLLVVAGNETTRNSISHGMKALTDFPDQRRAWQADFDGVARTAIEEIVRWASPVIFMRRTLTQDHEMRGQQLKAGDKVVLWYNSGDRDEEVFEDPYRFDLRRDPNEHCGFGGPGPHFCLGANLARREIQVFFRHIFDHLPDLEITGEPERLHSNFIHGIKHMDCSFTPKRLAL